jgi:hypothetical protein
MGIRNVLRMIREEFPHLAFGYFNPPDVVQAKYNELRVELGK